MRWIAALFVVAAACGTLPGHGRADPAVSGSPAREGAAPPWGQTDAAAAAPPVAAREGTLLRRSPESAERAAQQTATGDAPALNVGRIVSALAVVLALIFVLRWAGKRLMSGSGGGRGSRAVQVLSRTVLAPRQQVLLLQVGRRVIVVGDSGQQMTPLAEISDPDEIASLIAQADPQGPDALTRAFGSLFSRAGARFAAAPVAASSDGADDVPPDPDHADVPPPSPSSEAGAEVSDPALAATRAQLSGLAERVRLVSRQFRQS